MKNIIIKSIFITVLIISLTSCQDWYEDNSSFERVLTTGKWGTLYITNKICYSIIGNKDYYRNYENEYKTADYTFQTDSHLIKKDYLFDTLIHDMKWFIKDSKLIIFYSPRQDSIFADSNFYNKDTFDIVNYSDEKIILKYTRYAIAPSYVDINGNEYDSVVYMITTGKWVLVKIEE